MNSNLYNARKFHDIHIILSITVLLLFLLNFIIKQRCKILNQKAKEKNTKDQRNGDLLSIFVKWNIRFEQKLFI